MKVHQILTNMDVGFTNIDKTLSGPAPTEAGGAAGSLTEYLATTKTTDERSQVKSGHMADEERLVALHILDRCNFTPKLFRRYGTLEWIGSEMHRHHNKDNSFM